MKTPKEKEQQSQKFDDFVKKLKEDIGATKEEIGIIDILAQEFKIGEGK